MFGSIASFIVGVSSIFLAYYLAAVGHGLMEKSGVLNLAIDGVFTLGVAIAFAISVYTFSVPLATFIAMIVAAMFGLMLAFITTKLPISHGAAGLSTMFLGYGLAALVGLPARQLQINGRSLATIQPSLGGTWIWFYVVASAVAVGIWYLVEKTKIGAAIRAAGENPASAEALGVNVLAVRLFASGVGYALIGLGAAMFELAYTQVWSQGAGMGYGWIAFAISLSAGRHPILILISAMIFAALDRYRFLIAAIYNLPPDVGKMLPFVAAIAAMIIFMVTPLKRKLAPPKSLGKIYFREERSV